LKSCLEAIETLVPDADVFASPFGWSAQDYLICVDSAIRWALELPSDNRRIHILEYAASAIDTIAVAIFGEVMAARMVSSELEQQQLDIELLLSHADPPIRWIEDRARGEMNRLAAMFSGGLRTS
jgi:hypothetical protein